jgi:hypothetical protein
MENNKHKHICTFDLGTFTIKIVDDGNGISFTASPTSLGIISVLVFTIFPPYTLLFFLCLHGVLSNTDILVKINPYFGSSCRKIKAGTKVFIEITKDILSEMSQHEYSDMETAEEDEEEDQEGEEGEEEEEEEEDEEDEEDEDKEEDQSSNIAQDGGDIRDIIDEITIDGVDGADGVDARDINDDIIKDIPSTSTGVDEITDLM